MGAKPEFVTQEHTTNMLPGVPVCTRETYAAATGLPPGVVNAHCDRGYLPTVRVGKYSLINLEALRIACARHALEFTL